MALCHLFFNVLGILVWYPLPRLRAVPLALAKRLGRITADHRWFAALYIALMFFLLPAAVLALSILGWHVLLAVLLPICGVVASVAAISVLQKRRPDLLPVLLRTWKFLPVWLRSLDPYDEWVWRAVSAAGRCRRRRKEGEDEEEGKDLAVNGTMGNGDHTVGDTESEPSQITYF